jgi:hypothetical protein
MPQFNGAGGTQNWQQQRAQAAMQARRGQVNTQKANVAAAEQAKAQAAAQADALRTQQARQRQMDEEANQNRMYQAQQQFYGQSNDSPGA